MRPCNAQLFPSLHATPASRGRARTTRTPRPLLQRSCNGFHPQHARGGPVSMRPAPVNVHGLGPACRTAAVTTPEPSSSSCYPVYTRLHILSYVRICMHTYLHLYTYANTCVNSHVRTSIYTQWRGLLTVRTCLAYSSNNHLIHTCLCFPLAMSTPLNCHVFEQTPKSNTTQQRAT